MITAFVNFWFAAILGQFVIMSTTTQHVGTLIFSVFPRGLTERPTILQDGAWIRAS
jgi:hypothetical protein